MQSLNIQFDSLRQSPTVAMADRVMALKASGRKIVGLQVGDPDFATPQAVQEVAFKAMQQGLTHYGPSKGYPELRRAAALKLERDSAVSYDPETELLITIRRCGAKLRLASEIELAGEGMEIVADRRAFSLKQLKEGR